MKTISGHVICISSLEPLYSPILYWFERDGEIYEQLIQTDTKGQFKLALPPYIDKLYVASRGYAPREINIKPHVNKLWIYLSRN